MHATAHAQRHTLVAQSGRTLGTQHSLQCRRSPALSPTVPARSLLLGLQRYGTVYALLHQVPCEQRKEPAAAYSLLPCFCCSDGKPLTHSKACILLHQSPAGL